MCPMLLLAATLTLTPSQDAALTVSHARLTHGLQGPLRTDAKFLPGDSLFLAFDIDGLRADDQGKVRYSTGLVVTDAQGKMKFKQDPRAQDVLNALGGGHLPAFAHVDVGLNQPPGRYTVKVTVTDPATNHSASFSKQFEVLPAGFGLVRLTTTSDAKGEIPVPLIGEGQSVWINFAAVAFKRDPGTKRGRMAVAMRVLDEDGRPTVPQPFTGQIDQELPESLTVMPMQFVLPVNRRGKFTVALKATDQISQKTATLTFPLTVLKVE